MPPIRRHTPHQTADPHFTTLPEPGVAERREYDPRLRPGLCLLLDGHYYAQELGRDRWEFAVEIELLHAAGLNNNDLRWLVGKGYAEQSVETKSKGKVRRLSHRAGRFVPPRGSCYALTDAGVELVQKVLAAPEAAIPRRGTESQSEGGQAAQEDRPHWDVETHSLYWRGQLVKHFKHEAPFQEAILEAFQASNWSRFVVVTLPKEDGVNPKERLRVTIKNLNRGCGRRIQFTQEGNGARVGWRPVD